MDKVSLLVAAYGKELGLKTLLIYVILALTQSCVGLLEWSYFRFTTVKHLSFCFF